MTEYDIAIIGAGAAGLAAAIFAAEAAGPGGARILLIDGAKKPGAKILVSGGGRCNVTNKTVTPEDFWGGTRPIVRNILRSFDESRTIEWMRDLGVPLKLEPTGKYFPVTDLASSVLDALLRRVAELGVELRTGTRVVELRRAGERWELLTPTLGESIRARRVVVATGGLALPKSGSDGAGLEMMRRLGHAIVPTTPALCPLRLMASAGLGGRFAEFSGIAIEARLALKGARGETAFETQGSLLFTHFGLSGPCALDFSRHWLRARLERPQEVWRAELGLRRFKAPADADRWLQDEAKARPKRQVASALAEILPTRIAEAMAEGMTTFAELSREARLTLAKHLAAMPIEIVESRGYPFAEVTAGGVDLKEVDPKTMESRVAPGIHLCGEILDVDGRIGGFNFQWAWASGYLAGRGAAQFAVGSGAARR